MLAAILLLTNLKAPVMTEYGPVQTKVDGDNGDHGLPETGVRLQTRGRRETVVAGSIYNLKVVYPDCFEANATLHAMEQRMDSMKRENRNSLQAMERRKQAKIHFVLKNMTSIARKAANQLIEVRERIDQTSTTWSPIARRIPAHFFLAK